MDPVASLGVPLRGGFQGRAEDPHRGVEVPAGKPAQQALCAGRSRRGPLSLKDYYLGLTLGTQDPTSISEQYVSLATGNLCRTLASRFNDASGKEYILCMDTRSV